MVTIQGAVFNQVKQTYVIIIIKVLIQSFQHFTGYLR